MTSSAVTLSIVALWLLVAVLVILVLLLYRQFGLIMMPASGRAALRGLDVGSSVPKINGSVTSTGGSPVDLDGALRGGLALLVAASPNCPVCERIWGELSRWPFEPGLATLVWIDGDGASRGSHLPGWLVCSSTGEAAHALLQVPVVPFFYLISKGAIMDKGLATGTAELRDRLVRFELSRELT